MGTREVTPPPVGPERVGPRAGAAGWEVGGEVEGGPVDRLYEGGGQAKPVDSGVQQEFVPVTVQLRRRPSAARPDEEDSGLLPELVKE